MSLTATNNVDTNKYEFLIDITPERLEKAIQDAYLKAKNNITVKGFRKGKVPRHMVEKLYGEQCFFEDAVQILVREEVAPEMEKSEIQLVSAPDVEVESINKRTGVKFKLTGFTKPDVEISDYKGIEVTRTVETIDDKMIDSYIDDVLHKNARILSVTDRAAELGDTVIIDYEGFIDGEAFDGGAEKQYSLKLGSGAFIPGFEDQIVGKDIDEEFTISVTFPENYQMAELAGKAAEFNIVLHEIKAEELPVFDDEFVKDISEFDNIADYREDLRKQLNEYSEKQADARADDDLYTKVAEKVSAEIPEVMIHNKIHDLVNEIKYRIQMQGFDFNTYCELTGTTEKALHDAQRDKATEQVKLRLALEKIADLEGVAVTDEQVEEEIRKMAEDYNKTVLEIKNIVNTKEVKSDLAVREAAKIVKDSAVITTVEAKKPEGE
ncbi:MAG: trigger factor [Ruminococcus sp.]|nr:trigger factor [Ruminococcus sp.]